MTSEGRTKFRAPLAYLLRTDLIPARPCGPPGPAGFRFARGDARGSRAGSRRGRLPCLPLGLHGPQVELWSRRPGTRGS